MVDNKIEIFKPSFHKKEQKLCKYTYFVGRLERNKLMENTACKYRIKEITLTKLFKFSNTRSTRRNRNHVRAHIL